MTSKGSLEKKRSFLPLLHEILWTARRYWWVSLVGMLLFLGFTLVGMRLEGNDPSTFSIIMWDSEVTMRIVGVVYGVFAAFCLFRFLWSRRESVLYLSVGTARWKQFAIRYLFGLASVILGVAVPFLVTYHTEMQGIGGDASGLCAHYTLVYVFSMVTLVLLSYTVGVLVSVLCGHFLSALLTIAGVLAAPYTLLWGVQKILGFYLFGTPLGESLLTDHLGAGLFTMLAEQMPHKSYNRFLLERYEALATTDGLTMAEVAKAEISLPTVRIILLFVLMAVLALLAGFAYCRRPAEQAGKATVHPILSHAVALTGGLCLASLVLSVKAPAEGVGGMVILTVLFLLAFILAASLVRLLLIRDLKGTLRHYPIPCGAAVVCLLFTVLLGTGWFGYASYIPDAEDVQRVTVTYNQNSMLMRPKSQSSTGFAFAPGVHQSGTKGFSNGTTDFSCHYAYSFSIHDDDYPELTTPEDIAIALGIHEAIVADGRQTYTGEAAPNHRETMVPVFYRVTYQLKNGETVERYYPYLTLATLEETVKAENTAAYRDEIATRHTHTHYAEAEAFEFGDPLFANFTSVPLSEEEREALQAALDADEAALSAEERYFDTGDPAKDQVVGIIRARALEVSGARLLNTHPTDRQYHTFYVTAAYERTLAFMEAKGLTSCFETNYKITEVRTQPYTPRMVTVGTERALSYVFFACDNVVQISLDPQYDSRDHMEQLTLNTSAVPEDEWDEYIANSRSVALMTRPGQMVQIMLENAEGETKLVTRYLYDE